jgi:membrane protein DedA with SNARE-associated domain
MPAWRRLPAPVGYKLSVQTFLDHAGYGALILLAFVEACCIPIPSEVTFGFAGVLAAQGRLNLALVIIIGSLAELAGSYVSWGVGRVGGRPLVDKLGRYVLVTKSDVDRAERWFARRGVLAVPIGRAMPVLRAFTSLVAGIAEVPAVRFGLLSLVGTVVYASALSTIGYEVGKAWHRVAHDFSLAGYVLVALVVIAAAAFVVHRLSELRKESRA